MKFLEREEGLICLYFNPMEELTDLQYLRLAKTFLNAYLRQTEIFRGESPSRYPSIEYTLAEMLSYIHDKCVRRWKIEKAEMKNEQLKKNEYLNISSIIPSMINFNASLLDFLESLRLGYMYDAIIKVAAESVYFIISRFMLRQLNGIFRYPKKEEFSEYLRNNVKNVDEFLLKIQKYVSSVEIWQFINNPISIDETYVKDLAKNLKKIREKYFKTTIK
ncbi:hypothetical protein J5U23_01456 [Saccharolobus shibatae B12]|uniref:Uncharacterized protein n=1 Tax=Saccharolobus shibatae (strain ATCC 51178 / DSM 5389 / JCM 8931 / NBRC 15437 / B12) TaxID=523848 RepID=A0A8F5BNK9_SACSH|nr:hypothetical protein [Saccharolobus shibatae]QXJ28587.1 hypothetical protein J5U23_01456 [Saccharolobus shibatae B12]